MRTETARMNTARCSTGPALSRTARGGDRGRRHAPAFIRAVSVRVRGRLVGLLTLLTLAGPVGCATRLDVPVPALSAPTPLPPSEPATITLPVVVALSTVRAQ